MEPSHQQSSNPALPGQIIIAANPSSHLPSQPKRKKKATANRRKKNKDGYQQQQSSINQIAAQGQANKQVEMRSDKKIKQADQQTLGELQQSGLTQPYQFLSQRSPSIFSIFFPRFTPKSLTLPLSILYLILFIALIAYNYTRTQTDLSWNCSLFKLQNKYYPKLRFSYQFWRVVPSFLFHSNIAHFCLNLFALQIYGYFVQWHYGKMRYLILFISTMLYSHFMSAALQMTSISTTPSAFLMAILALKIYFFWEYRIFLYILMALLFGINLIPIFVVNNVDYSAHLGGAITGGLLGLFYHLSKMEELSLCQKVWKWGSLVVLIVSFGGLVGVVFSNSNAQYQLLASEIDIKCASN